MLQITIDGREQWDEAKLEFVYTPNQTINLEHSLVSISKWESKWKKPFLNKIEKTPEELADYVRCMTVTTGVDQSIYNCLTSRDYEKVKQYIDDPMTATWFRKEDKKSSSRQTITSELIYYWMVALNIPFECQKWHLNRLLTLIDVCNEENKAQQKGTKTKKPDLEARAKLNAERRKKLNSTG